MLSLSARSLGGTVARWVIGESSSELVDTLTAPTQQQQSAPDASPDWSDLPSSLLAATAGCYEITTTVAGVDQLLAIQVA